MMFSKLKFLVTGATGFLGSHLVRSLVSKGRVRCLVRESSNIDALKKLDIEIVIGDLTNLKTLQGAVSGIDIVIHLAAVTTGKDKELYHRTIVDGTRNLVEACINGKIRKFIFVSSLDAKNRRGTYGSCKSEAEQIVKERLDKWLILRPAVIYGPGDKLLLGNLIDTIRKCPILPVIGSGKYLRQPTYVGDAVDIILQGIASKACNKIYNIGGPEITFNEILDTVCEVMGVKRKKVHIPVGIAKPLVVLYSRITGNSNLPVEQLLSIAEDKTFDTAKTVKDFEFKPINFKEGVKLTFSELGVE